MSTGWHRQNRQSPAALARKHRYNTPQHRALRKHYQQRLDHGAPINCWRCGQPVNPTDWHLGHDDHNPTIYRGPEHPTCNRNAAAKAGNRAQRRQALLTARRAQSRAW